MDDFSRIILEDTLELAGQLLPFEEVHQCIHRIARHVKVIAANPGDRHSLRELHAALTDLSESARQNQKFLIGTRLQSIARQVRPSDVA